MHLTHDPHPPTYIEWGSEAGRGSGVCLHNSDSGTTQSDRSPRCRVQRVLQLVCGTAEEHRSCGSRPCFFGFHSRRTTQRNRTRRVNRSPVVDYHRWACFCRTHAFFRYHKLSLNCHSKASGSSVWTASDGWIITIWRGRDSNARNWEVVSGVTVV